MLLFHAGESRYAMSGEDIIEVIPNVGLVAVNAAKLYVAGMLNYGGTTIPVLDFCILMQGKPCRAALHTRIIVVQGNVNGEDVTVGLRAEKVTEVSEIDPESFHPDAMMKSPWPFLGGILTDEQVLVQLVEGDKFLAWYCAEAIG